MLEALEVGHPDGVKLGGAVLLGAGQERPQRGERDPWRGEHASELSKISFMTHIEIPRGLHDG